jgi:magnesium-transporting ATPase (P-type)
MPSAPADRTDRTRLDGRPWHSMLAEETTRCLGVHRAAGLSTDDARVRAAEYGPNALEERAGRGLRQILWEQVSSVMIVILMVAGVLALLFKSGDGPPLDAIAIFAIIVLFVVLGVLQEYRAQRAIAALRRMSSPTVKAVRDGRLKELSAHELVPGDVVRLETGSVVPADCRILESVNLRVQEAALTGESEPIEKVVGAFDRVDLPLGDRRNMGYMGTFVTYGRGEAVVVETGMRTELGKIATMIQSVEHEPTPLQKRLDRLGKTLAVIAVVVAAAVALIGLVVEGKTWAEVLIIAIAIAVAIVPEGLPAVQTFALAIGAQRMAKRKALIRKLPAVETLGSVTVICSDKTGTLTQNRMTVTALVTMERSGRPRHRSRKLRDASAAAVAARTGRGCGALQRRHPERRRRDRRRRPHRSRAGGGGPPLRPGPGQPRGLPTARGGGAVRLGAEADDDGSPHAGGWRASRWSPMHGRRTRRALLRRPHQGRSRPPAGHLSIGSSKTAGSVHSPTQTAQPCMRRTSHWPPREFACWASDFAAWLRHPTTRLRRRWNAISCSWASSA